MDYKKYINLFKEKINDNILSVKNLNQIKKEISSKVNENNNYKLFYGDTSVFKMNKNDIKNCSILSKEIFNFFSDYLVYLEPETFHITLTSFNNPYVLNTYDKDKIFNEIEKTKPKIKDVFKKISKYKEKIITFKTYKLDLTSAILLRVYPKDENDYLLLMDIRKEFDNLNNSKNREINFYLPHVSLGYLNNKVDQNILNTINNYIYEKEFFDFEIKVKVKDLFYQYHNHMGEFIDLYNLE